MTPLGSSKADRPLDFHGWLQWRGMNPSRRRPLGRQAALFMEYRAYLEHKVGAEDVQTWFDKFTKKLNTQ